MIAEGLFTEDEVNAASAYGATVKMVNGGRRELHFPSEEKYAQWMDEQQKLHPNRWADAVRIPVKVNTR